MKLEHEILAECCPPSVVRVVTTFQNEQSVFILVEELSGTSSRRGVEAACHVCGVVGSPFSEPRSWKSSDVPRRCAACRGAGRTAGRRARVASSRRVGDAACRAVGKQHRSEALQHAAVAEEQQAAELAEHRRAEAVHRAAELEEQQSVVAPCGLVLP